MKQLITKIFDKVFLKFVLVGIINTIFGTGIMFVFYNFLGFNYWFSSISNYVLGSILSYILNRFFTFKKSGMSSRKTICRFVVNITICYSAAYGIAKPLAAFLLQGMTVKLQENIAMCIGMCLFVGLNYLGQRYFVFKYDDQK